MGNPDPATEVACTHGECLRPWRWGRGRRLAAPAPESTKILSLRSWSIRGLGPPIGDPDPLSRFSMSSVGVGDLGDGVGVSD
ncbi:hypothetical protein CRG98_003478 [Punica granatum]|uniref:Uncharacterized protein n=1 Tax=Punica granatum TaxID=22663 RepID=A0A2I0L5X7_PUNGR|nr:hypothetical protein CRG98_003478 [Punica granatum]